MQGYDDITGFTLKTGVGNYKILSEYNADNALEKWSIIERINGLTLSDAINPQITGTSEFNNIAAIQKKMPATIEIQPPADSPSRVIAAENQPSGRAAGDQSRVRTRPSAGDKAFSDREIERFSTLFKPSGHHQTNNQQAQPERELPLSTLFNRIASCR